MRIDVVTIFPDFFAPLDVSLVGRARRSGLLDVRVHDLRTWTHDRHRTVDDTPYGGGAGMVMRPEPWGEALDSLTGAAEQQPVLVVPTPSGEPFTQRTAERLADQDWLLFACGRYEGIDERVMEHARSRMPVCEVSLGDYVLNGGEVAALAVVESVVRLLPGFMGNPDSLTEESHGADRLLEYPLFTKPPTWRGLDVPEVLLTGDHGKVAAWRHAEAVRRTARRRPDLVHPSQRLTATGRPDEATEIRVAAPADVPELYTLQRAGLLREAELQDSLDVPGVHEDLDAVAGAVRDGTTVLVRDGGRLVASARGRLAEGEATWLIDRIAVAPDLEPSGMVEWLLQHLETLAPAEAGRVAVIAGRRIDLRTLRRAGYRPTSTTAPGERGIRAVKDR